MSIEYNKVTKLSKFIALLLFVSLPFIGFVLGMRYQKMMSSISTSKIEVTAPIEQEPNVGYMKEMIIVDFPKPEDTVSSPLIITGKARGGWYFEGGFPISLYCGPNGKIADSHATAQGEWMTDDFVDFEGIIEFETECESMGMLILNKNNPSDLRELDDKVMIPVYFE